MFRNAPTLRIPYIATQDVNILTAYNLLITASVHVAGVGGKSNISKPNIAYKRSILFDITFYFLLATDLPLLKIRILYTKAHCDVHLYKV
jgi:hypothetical protein